MIKYLTIIILSFFLISCDERKVNNITLDDNSWSCTEYTRSMIAAGKIMVPVQTCIKYEMNRKVTK